jgi:hypothetical protein
MTPVKHFFILAKPPHTVDDAMLPVNRNFNFYFDLLATELRL